MVGNAVKNGSYLIYWVRINGNQYAISRVLYFSSCQFLVKCQRSQVFCGSSIYLVYFPKAGDNYRRSRGAEFKELCSILKLSDLNDMIMVMGDVPIY